MRYGYVEDERLGELAELSKSLPVSPVVPIVAPPTAGLSVTRI